MASWATYIRNFRRRQQLTQEEAARLLGVSQPTFSRWESGKQVPDPVTRRRIQDTVDALTGVKRRLIEEIVRRSPLPQALLDADLRILATSEPLRELLASNLPQARASQEDGHALGRRAFETLRLAREAGLERGAVAFVESVDTALGRDEREVRLRQFWVPLFTANARPFLRVEITAISEQSYERHLQEHPRVRVTTLEEIARAVGGRRSQTATDRHEHGGKSLV